MRLAIVLVIPACRLFHNALFCQRQGKIEAKTGVATHGNEDFRPNFNAACGKTGYYETACCPESELSISSDSMLVEDAEIGRW